MDKPALTGTPAPQQNQTVPPLSLGTGVMGHPRWMEEGEGEGWSWTAEGRRVLKSWALMPPVQSSWYQSGQLDHALTHIAGTKPF